MRRTFPITLLLLALVALCIIGCDSSSSTTSCTWRIVNDTDAKIKVSYLDTNNIHKSFTVGAKESSTKTIGNKESITVNTSGRFNLTSKATILADGETLMVKPELAYIMIKNVSETKKLTKLGYLCNDGRVNSCSFFSGPIVPGETKSFTGYGAYTNLFSLHAGCTYTLHYRYEDDTEDRLLENLTAPLVGTEATIRLKD